MKTLNDIRSTFLGYFEKQGHSIQPSSPPWATIASIRAFSAWRAFSAAAALACSAAIFVAAMLAGMALVRLFEGAGA